MKKIKFALLAFVAIMMFMCVSCDENTESKSNDTKKNSEITINETTKVDDFECKIKEINWYSPDDFVFDCVEREEGFEYIVVVLSETNTTDETKNAPTAQVLSADGQQCTNKAALSLYKNTYKINFGATLPHTTAEAYTIYQVPAGAQSFKLQILSGGFGANSDYIIFDRSNIT